MKLKLKVQKVNQINPANKKKGFAARVVSNGTAEFGDLCEQASLNTTYNPAEVEACAKLFVQAVVAELKKGMIVDLGPIGKLRPSCTSGWKETAEELTMDAIRTHVNYDASDDIKAAIQGASLSWAKASDEEENDNDNPGSEQGGGEMPPMSME